MNFPPKVVCLGEGLVDRLLPPGVDSKNGLPGQFVDRLGGAPANVAAGLSRLGTPVAFVGRLGSDAIGDSFANFLNRRGVVLAGLQRDSLRPTRIVQVLRYSDGERVFHGFVGDKGNGFADQALDCSEVQAVWPALSVDAQWLLLGTISLTTASSANTLRWVVKQAIDAGLRIALDINWRPTFWDSTADPNSGPSESSKSIIKPLLDQVCLIKLSRQEALWFFNNDDPGAIQNTLAQRPDVVVTDGSSPVRWQFGSESGHQFTFKPVSIVDTTGAGDAFMAGILHCWDLSPVERIRFAVACGALVCSGAGGIDPQPTHAQVEAFLGEVS